MPLKPDPTFYPSPASAAEGPAKEWTEIDLWPEGGKRGDNLVADVTDYFREPVEDQQRVRFQVLTVDCECEAVFHLEERFGRQVAVVEVEACR